MICTFFGHRTVSISIVPELKSTIIKLIEQENVNSFYVGNQGEFDSIVYRVLEELSKKYNISYYIVLAYIPVKKDGWFFENNINTLIPECIENVPRRFAISYRNKWMIEKSDFVVTYVTDRIASGAARFKELSERKGKKVINITVKI